MADKLHIGQKIREVMRDKNITVTLLAANINTTRTNMHKILQKSNMDIELLARISVALGHDFFKDISENMDFATVSQIDTVSDCDTVFSV